MYNIEMLIIAEFDNTTIAVHRSVISLYCINFAFDLDKIFAFLRCVAMGSYRSGRRRQTDRKRNTSEFLRLDSFSYIKPLAELNSTDETAGWHDNRFGLAIKLHPDRIIREYNVRKGASWQTAQQTIRFDFVSNHYGGQDRVYFQCPKCSGRSRFLYIGESVLLCRKCANLNYRSQQQTKDWSKAQQDVRDFIKNKFHDKTKLSSPQEIVRHKSPRPKGMHNTTYDRLLGELNQL